jgi:hypothetical protein
MPAAAHTDITSDSNREITHHFTLGADVILFATVVTFVARTAFSGSTKQSSFSRWGPLSLVSFGALLLILDPTRHVLLDHGGVFFKERTLAMYSKHGGLSAIGKFCQISSIVGLSLFSMGMMWHIRLPEKLSALVCGRSVRSL